MLIAVMLKRMGSPDKEFRPDALRFLRSLVWKENIRGLDKVCNAAVLHCKLPIVGKDDLLELGVVQQQLREEAIDAANLFVKKDGHLEEQPLADRLSAVADELVRSDQDIAKHLIAIETRYYAKLLAEEKSLNGLAKRVKIDRATLRRKLKALGITSAATLS